MSSDKVIGIDLGTTNSCVAIFDGDTAVVIPNRNGYRTTPSIVAVAPNGRRLVGQTARRQAITNAEHTAFATKRLIGRTWDSSVVRDAIAVMPYRITRGPRDDVHVLLRDQTFSIPELAAVILQDLKAVAEEHLGEPVEKAVVTVPAYFNDAQRKATKEAGRIAGLDIIRILNEPTAAALAYGYGRATDRRVVVYDFGGGTFDVSILDIGNDVFEVIATAGDTFLGGEDFDQRIVEWIVDGFLRETGFDLRSDRVAMQRVRDIAERTKCELSVLDEVEINLPFVAADRSGPLHLLTSLSRIELEALTSDLIDRTIAICARTLAEAELRCDEIDEVILVGGMTRMPRVQTAVTRLFGRAPSKQVNPDEAIAVGAAIQGAVLVEGNAEVLLLDVTPHALGIMIAGGYCHRLVERNTTVPASAQHVFTTVKDNQTSVRILVMQGDADRAEANELLGEFTLHGLRRARRGEVEIDVTFHISADGIVSVTARDLETGLEQSITIAATPAPRQLRAS